MKLTVPMAVIAMCMVGAQVASAQPFRLGPPTGQGPVEVEASFQLLDINDIDDEAETFEFSGILVLRWRDERRAFNPAVAGVDEKVFQGDYQFNEVATGWFPQVVLINESGLFEKHGVILRVGPDGTSTLVQTVNATAEADMELRRYPYDRQQLRAAFGVLGATDSEVVLRARPAEFSRLDHELRTPQWDITEVRTSTAESRVIYAGSERSASAFVVSADVERESFFVVRLVVIPLVLIVRA